MQKRAPATERSAERAAEDSMPMAPQASQHHQSFKSAWSRWSPRGDWDRDRSGLDTVTEFVNELVKKIKKGERDYVQYRRKDKCGKKEHSFSLFWLVKKWDLKDSVFFKPMLMWWNLAIQKSILGSVWHCCNQKNPDLLWKQSEWKTINSLPSNSCKIILLLLLGDKNYIKQMHLIRKRKTKDIQEKKGKHKKADNKRE